MSQSLSVARDAELVRVQVDRRTVDFEAKIRDGVALNHI
jgi:hypothetical protein